MIDGYGLSNVHMDGGSSRNILYVEMLQRMKLFETQLKHSNVVFHGVVPGRQGQSLGSITLDVVFGTPDNYHLDPLTFEVVPFKSAYHAIFGRLAFAAFMSRSCYIYSKLNTTRKMVISGAPIFLSSGAPWCATTSAPLLSGSGAPLLAFRCTTAISSWCANVKKKGAPLVKF
jgi:hypothetical protein